MAGEDSHHMDRRGFLATASKTALLGSGLLAAGWPKGAGAIMNVPPLAVDAQMMFRYDNVKREFYWWFFQQQVSNQIVAMNDFAFIDASDDLPHAKDGFRDPRHLDATLGYYRAFFDPKRFATPETAAEQTSVWGKPIPQRSLYLHGSQDGLFPMEEQELNAILPFLGPGSEVAMVPGVGHFMLVEDPSAVNARILAFIAG